MKKIFDFKRDRLRNEQKLSSRSDEFVPHVNEIDNSNDTVSIYMNEHILRRIKLLYPHLWYDDICCVHTVCNNEFTNKSTKELVVMLKVFDLFVKSEEWYFIKTKEEVIELSTYPEFEIIRNNIIDLLNYNVVPEQLISTIINENMTLGMSVQCYKQLTNKYKHITSLIKGIDDYYDDLNKYAQHEINQIHQIDWYFSSIHPNKNHLNTSEEDLLLKSIEKEKKVLDGLLNECNFIQKKLREKYSLDTELVIDKKLLKNIEEKQIEINNKDQMISQELKHNSYLWVHHLENEKKYCGECKERIINKISQLKEQLKDDFKREEIRTTPLIQSVENLKYINWCLKETSDLLIGLNNKTNTFFELEKSDLKSQTLDTIQNSFKSINSLLDEVDQQQEELLTNLNSLC
ncbi:hypothetical protein EHI8A_048230 [Entamoeba histolytica HM-1:IMSS-B]|uniref:Uncharacterized protein n=5 Tax=Entamoeba histolytica TaxID=5759 RepID=C4LT89_ENTH1|nr:hypothetical protein EHI_044700 [Entamoeba histolytica HM-1:IMSS]EMD47560.1 Hypothetical protein EHI5A_073150 [Entamoeba histolytica KU27]EMH73589.1 hypothetical protein EHI8A_048230 [Entamoeba histolytica HM-1:IMSS-B]ENY61649.1 hypothetical protein EHI7A_048340 [Entamoeba histolytica HM-1:IMSS-A]GAT91766.1 hypothetical protein CL6EHI_044700 [Entamoeba histolytica]EAL51844.1 hypothetical protein EHI_044700 [Entamoeba histolytica HM-1:IMSS]|eukprot:XP_657229.1 hypothetical protein EHI_044700 [Entamoeba histolytica HM-1:IMSS]